MNYGANWTGWPGSNTSASSSNYNIEKQHFAPIIDGLESTDYIERYAVYNDVQECRYMYNAYDASLSSTNYLTPMGVYYANKASNIGYKASYNTYVPSTVAYSTNLTNPVLSSVLINSQSDETTVKWTDSNGEYIKIMYEKNWLMVHGRSFILSRTSIQRVKLITMRRLSKAATEVRSVFIPLTDVTVTITLANCLPLP